jgi:hypothetical protein
MFLLPLVAQQRGAARLEPWYTQYLSTSRQQRMHAEQRVISGPIHIMTMSLAYEPAALQDVRRQSNLGWAPAWGGCFV